jgi:uncharacterized protein DUF998
MKPVRALAWFAIGAQVVFVAAWIVAGALEDGYSHLDHHVSELGADGAANPGIVNAAIVVLGLGIAALAPALLRVLPRRPSARVAAGLFLVSGIAIVVSGLFNADCSSAVDATCQDRWDAWDVDTSAKIHAWSSFAAQLLFLATPFALARALWNRPVAAPTLACGVSGVILSVGLTALFGIDHAPDGLTQRLGLGLLHAWVIFVAIGILWETRSAPEPPPATPMRPRDFFGSGWTGEGELVPWPYFFWRRFPQRVKVRREATFFGDDAWQFDDRAWRPDGTLIEERRLYCRLESPDRVRVLSDRLLGAAEILLEEDGYRIVPYRVAIPVGPVHFGLKVRDSATVDDGTLVNRLKISWFGLPVARVELRARPTETYSRASS